MTRILLAATAAFALLSGCAHAPPAETAVQPAAAAPAPGPSGGMDMTATCPMNVPGTQVSAADVEGGATLTFTTPDQVVELRRRVHAMAAMHNEHHAVGAGHPGMMGGGMMGGMMGSGKAMGAMRMPPSQATVVDLENGAAITLVPNAPDDLQELRSAAHMHAQHMQENGCGMMGHGRGS